MQAYPERYVGKPNLTANLRVCSACGAAAKRKFAKYCPDCGKSLWEDYQPLDHLRASYRLQGKNFEFEKAGKESLFGKTENSSLDVARAFLVYSMVPYLGVLFVPGAVFMGFFSLLQASRNSQKTDLKNSAACILLSFLILSAQLLLWWLFYAIPEL